MFVLFSVCFEQQGGRFHPDAVSVLPLFKNCVVRWTLSTVFTLDNKYPVNMPDPARIRFGCGQLWPLRPAASRNRPGSDLLDPDRTRIGPGSDDFFSALEVARITIIGSVFVHPARIRYRCVWPDPLGLNEARSDPPPAKRIRTTSGISLPARFWQNATRPVLAKHNWPGSDLVLDGHVRLWSNGSEPEASRCTARFRPTASGMFSG